MTIRELRVGIDHGTTNSSIGFVEGGNAVIIQPQVGMDGVMPSAVYVNKRGRVLLGAAAINAMTDSDGIEEGEGYTGYKLRIGKNEYYEFRAAQKIMSAPELGSLVISELLKAYREATQDSPVAAVITVPAMFDQPAYEGTRKAAIGAGLRYYPLLMEPVAASLAYGIEAARDDQGKWIVFDLGGGTLDVSLMEVSNRKLVPVEDGHAGDSYLGGRKFDRELMSYVLAELRKQYDLTGFAESNPHYRVPWRKLELCVERAKIELSQKQQTVVARDRPLFVDGKRKEVMVDIPITRDQYHKLIRRDVDRAIHVCQTLLRAKKLDQTRLRMLLVGGPTYTPYLRQELANQLKVELDTTISPMTAVAKGAALHASTLEIPTEVRKLIGPATQLVDGIDLKLAYERKSGAQTYLMEGVVEARTIPNGALFIEVKRKDRGWSSGRIPVKEDGSFSVPLLLVDRGRATQSCFVTCVLDSSGRELLSRDEPEIWYPSLEAEITLARSLRVGTKDNLTHLLLRHGTRLPAKANSHGFVSAETITKGSGQFLRIPVFEGVPDLGGEEDEHADCNIHVGSLVIDDLEFERDLPAGADVDITVSEDESRQITVEARIPWFKRSPTFKATFESSLSTPPPDQEQITKRFSLLKRSIEQCRTLQQAYALAEPGKLLEDIANKQVVEDIAVDLERGKEGEADSRSRAIDRILSLATTMYRLHALQTSARIKRYIHYLEPLVRDEAAQDLADIKEDFAKASAAQDFQGLVRIEERVDDLDWNVRRQWVYELDWDLYAIPEGYATPEQMAAYKEGKEALAEIQGSEEYTFEQVERARNAHWRLRSAFPELAEWVEAARARDSGRQQQTEGPPSSTIERRRNV